METTGSESANKEGTALHQRPVWWGQDEQGSSSVPAWTGEVAAGWVLTASGTWTVRVKRKGLGGWESWWH